MPAPVLLDLTHTSHTRARTGIQRVTRSLHAALGPGAVAVTHDPHLGAWRVLQRWEKTNLAAKSAAAKRNAAWPLTARLRGRAERLVGSNAARQARLGALNASAVIVPEV